MPVVIRSEDDWWDTINVFWNEVLFLFQNYIGLETIYKDGLTFQQELDELRKQKNSALVELLEELSDLLEPDELEIGEFQDILLELVEKSSFLFREKRFLLNKGRGNTAERLKQNEGLQDRIERFRRIMGQGD